MKNDKGFLDMHQPMSKTQPGKPSDPACGDMSGRKNTDCNYLGDGKDFNYKGKVSKEPKGDYHDLGRPSSGLYGNFSDKDASMEYLRNRNKMGQEVTHYSATSEESKIHTYGGTTAYDSRPIPETYHPATSQGEVPANAVVYEPLKKERNADMKNEVDTESNKLQRPISKHLKGK